MSVAANKNILTPDEIVFIQMSLQQTIEDLQVTSSDPKMPFTPQARQDMRDMLRTGESALQKLQATTGHTVRMDAYNEGDEKDFMTKES